MLSSNKINWLIESDVFDENIDRLCAEIQIQGHKYIVVPYEPFESSKKYLTVFPKEEPTIFYGSINFATQIKRESEWVPGLFWTKDKYRCRNYYPHLSKYILPQNYAFLPWGDVLNKKKWLFKTFGSDNRIFIRPDQGEKVFTGLVISFDEFEDKLGKICYNEPNPEELVVVSTPKNIVKEWRFIVSHDKVIAGSLYKENGWKKTECYQHRKDSGRRHSLTGLLNRVIKSYNPDPIYCLDICQTKPGYYYVVEIGAFSVAGLYDCNLREVVKAVSEVTYKEWKEFNE